MKNAASETADDSIRDLERATCEALGIPSDGWRVEYRADFEQGGRWSRSGRMTSEAHALVEAGRKDMNGWTVKPPYPGFPAVITDPAAFDLVVQALAKIGVQFKVSPRCISAQLTLLNRTKTREITGATWREAVCRAVLEMHEATLSESTQTEG